MIIVSVHIRGCRSTLYVGLECTAPPTNTNFRLTFLLTRLQEALNEDLKLYRALNLKSTSLFWPQFHSGSQFLVPAKNVFSCDFFIIIIMIIKHFFRLVFSEYTEANTTSLIPLDTILPEIFAFIIGFSFTVWTKMRPSK